MPAPDLDSPIAVIGCKPHESGQVWPMRSRVPLVAALVLLISLALAWLLWPRSPTEFEPLPPPDEPWPTPAAHDANPDEPQMRRPEPPASDGA
jgi:hypothetical protein